MFILDNQILSKIKEILSVAPEMALEGPQMYSACSLCSGECRQDCKGSCRGGCKGGCTRSCKGSSR